MCCIVCINTVKDQQMHVYYVLATHSNVYNICRHWKLLCQTSLLDYIDHCSKSKYSTEYLGFLHNTQLLPPPPTDFLHNTQLSPPPPTDSGDEAESCPETVSGSHTPPLPPSSPPMSTDKPTSTDEPGTLNQQAPQTPGECEFFSLLSVTIYSHQYTVRQSVKCFIHILE